MSKDISQYSFGILLDDDVSAKFFLLLLLYFVYICIFTTRINRVDGVMLDWIGLCMLVCPACCGVCKRFNIDTAPTIASALKRNTNPSSLHTPLFLFSKKLISLNTKLKV